MKKTLTSTSRRKKGDTFVSEYVLGGVMGFLTIIIFSVFSLSVLDRYLLNSPSLAAVISAVLVDLANADRSAHAVGGLTVSPLLTAAAQAKADDMAAKGYFAHISPDGKNSWHWFKQAGYTFLYAGENLAVDFSDSIDVERAWMDSPTHRANILDGNFTQIGIASAQGVYEGRPTTFVVQMFGTPAPTKTPSEVRTLSTSADPTTPALATTKPVAPAPAPEVAAVPIAVTAVTAPVTTQVLGTESGAVVSTSPQASWWQNLLASPLSMLRYAYLGLALVILMVLAYVTELEFHRRHLRHVAATMLLFVVMVALFIYADSVLFSEPVIAALTS